MNCLLMVFRTNNCCLKFIYHLFIACNCKIIVGKDRTPKPLIHTFISYMYSKFIAASDTKVGTHDLYPSLF